MSLLSLVAALLLEQWRPLADRRHLYALLARYATFLEGLFNAGDARQGALAWLLAVLPVVSGAALYLTMGFRHRLHLSSDLQLALKGDDVDKARDILSAWRQVRCADLNR